MVTTVIIALFPVRDAAADNTQKIPRLQTCSPYEHPIDFSRRDQFNRIVRTHAATVKNAGRLGAVFPKEFDDRLPDPKMRLTGLIRRRVAAGADRPDWLVRNLDVFYSIFLQPLQSVAQLACQDSSSQPLVSFAQGFSDAENGSKAGAHGSEDFVCDRLIGLAEDPAPFRVADDHKATSQLAEHSRAYFSREGALVLPVDVLTGQANGASGNRWAKLTQ